MKKNFSKIIAMALALIMLMAAIPAAVSAEETATINGTSVNVGDTVTVSWLLDTPSYVVNAEFNVKYPADMFELVSDNNAASFPVLSDAGLETNYTDGIVYAVATNASDKDSDLYDFTSEAVLCSLSFRVKTAGAANVAMEIVYVGGKNPDGISSNEVDYIADNKIVNDSTTLKSLVGAEEVPPTPPTPEYTLGDVNGNGNINAEDAALILQYFADINDDIITEAADVNGDENINAADAALILQHFADIIDTFPAEK